MSGFDNDLVTELVLSYRSTGDLNTLGKIALHFGGVVNREVAKYPHLLQVQQPEDWQQEFYLEKARGIIKHYKHGRGKLVSLVINSAQNFVRSKLIKHRFRGITFNSDAIEIFGNSSPTQRQGISFLALQAVEKGHLTHPVQHKKGWAASPLDLYGNHLRQLAGIKPY
jgi:hypothetical protein